MKFPKISVITVCYNAVDSIEETILSVFNQTYSNIEYIIIDGGSSDGTTEIIKKYAARLAYWSSESDKGIYDAMNKGIGVATGEYVNFMNAGDSFVSRSVIEEFCLFSNKQNADIIFGDTFICYEWGKVYKVGRTFRGKEWRLPFSHQSTFVRTEIIKQGFDTSFRFAADHNMLYSLFLQGYQFSRLPMAISNYNAYGVSNYNINSFKEVAKINNCTGIEYCLRLFYKYIKIQSYKLVPITFINTYRKIKRIF